MSSRSTGIETPQSPLVPKLPLGRAVCRVDIQDRGTLDRHRTEASPKATGARRSSDLRAPKIPKEPYLSAVMDHLVEDVQSQVERVGVRERVPRRPERLLPARLIEMGKTVSPRSIVLSQEGVDSCCVGREVGCVQRRRALTEAPVGETADCQPPPGVRFARRWWSRGTLRGLLARCEHCTGLFPMTLAD